MTSRDDEMMGLALDEAKKAMAIGEIPVASILVSKDGVLTTGQTQVKRRGSIAAHGELFAILDAKDAVYSADRPLVIYTTLEPCLMCIGAAMQAGIDEMIFGMAAEPDGGARFVEALTGSGQKVPAVRGGIREMEEVELMREFASNWTDSPAMPYVRALLAPYE